MLATNTVVQGLGLAIPLVVVVGIFIVSPLAHRNRWHAWKASSGDQTRSLEETQQKILEEVRALRTQLEEVQRVLASVE